jgi:hypothetical protein
MSTYFSATDALPRGDGHLKGGGVFRIEISSF